MPFLFLALGLGAASARAQSDQMGLRLEVDKREVKVGESVHLTIEFRRMGSGNVSIVRQPSIATPQLFDVRGSSSSTQVSMDGQQMVEISSTRVTLVASRAGTETLGPAVMVYQVPGKDREEIRSNGVMITVVEKPAFNPFAKAAKKDPPPAKAANDNALPSAPPAAPTPAPREDIRDLKPILTGIAWSLKILFWLIALILAVWGASRLVRRIMARRRVAAPVKGQGNLLRERWRRLSDEGLTGVEYSLEVSELLRECIEHRHGFPAPDLTTREVAAAMKKAGASPDSREAVDRCLRLCDGVLYAEGSLTLKDRQTMKATVGELLPKDR